MWVQLSIKHTRAYTTLFSNLIKRRLLLERKVMTNLDSILQSRDITLPTKVHKIKAMVFPVNRITSSRDVRLDHKEG